MHDRSMIINGNTQKASKVHNRSAKVHILSTKTVQCLLPSCRVGTCGDRVLQSCYSGKYHVFTRIRHPLSVTKIPSFPGIPNFPAFPAFPCFPHFPRHPQPRSARRSEQHESLDRAVCDQQTSVNFPPRKPRQGQQPSL